MSNNDTVKTGLVGYGARGFGLLSKLLRMKGIEVLAVCDIRDDRFNVK